MGVGLETTHGNFANIDLKAPDKALVARAARLLDGGEALVFPTDTVYGIGVAAGEGRVPDLLFELKRRDRAQTIPWLVAAPDDLLRYGRDLPESALRLAKAFWPGPFTIVVKASDAVPASFTGSDGTIALRMPDSPVALALMRALGAPLAATSANIHARPAVNDSAELDPELTALVPIVLAGGVIEGGLPSTIVSCVGPVPTVLREGSITPSQISAAC